MAKKIETKTEKIEKEYIIPLREKCRPAPRYKKTNKAIRTIKEFLVRHMKIRDRDLEKIRINNYLNDFMWARGIRNPPHKVKVKAIKEGDIVRVELVDFPEKLRFKKLREEAREQKAKEIGANKKKLAEKPHAEKPTGQEAKPLASSSKSQTKEKTEEKKKEEKEKTETSIESMKQIEKAAAKTAKHQAGGKTKEPKHLQRFALEK